MAQGTYLLRADIEDLERWKRAARERGGTFAAWVRDALDAAAEGGGLEVAPSAPADEPWSSPLPAAPLEPPRSAAAVEMLPAPGVVVEPAPRVSLRAAEVQIVPSGAGRSKMCIHRLRPDQFCKRCDG